MFENFFVGYIRKLTSTGMLLGIDDVEESLVARAAVAETALPKPSTPLIVYQPEGEEPQNGRKQKRLAAK